MDVDVVDMEAYAIAKVCTIKKVKFRCFKYISDNANDSADNDWNENLKIAAKKFEEFRSYNLL